VYTWGEGWHNNHHAHPVSARHGMAWFEIDINWYTVWALKKLGLAQHVHHLRLSTLNPANSGADTKIVATQPRGEMVSA
jgi:stearoyl-CoA desaturase (delta-9 desaturase)